jgi:acyl-CoA hydrolase
MSRPITAPGAPEAPATSVPLEESRRIDRISRTNRRGEVCIDKTVADAACDSRGALRGSKLLEWLDVVGNLAATRHGRAPSATLSIEACDVAATVSRGDRVTMLARPAHAAGPELGIAVAMVVRRGGIGAPRTASSGFLSCSLATPSTTSTTSAAAPARSPAIVPRTPDEVALHREGELRRQFERELVSGHAILSRPELILSGAVLDEPRRDSQILYLLRELARRLAARGKRSVSGLRSPLDSAIHRVEPARSGSPSSTLYRGALLHWLEAGAAASARAFVGAGVRLIGVHGLTFERPVPADAAVHIHAIAAHSDEQGVTIHVRADLAPASSPTTPIRAVRGFLTYAPVDPDVSVAAIARATAADAELFCEVALRKMLRDRVASLHHNGTPLGPESSAASAGPSTRRRKRDDRDR